MEYTEGLMRELENLVHFEKTDSLTEVGKKRIVALRKCRDNFKKLHLPDVVGQSEQLLAFGWYMMEHSNINDGKTAKDYLREFLSQ